MDNSSDYNVKSDLIFKYLFSNKEILKDFLEAVLNVEITSITAKEQFNIKQKDFFEKIAYLDIMATINDNSMINLEMQNREKSTYLKRIKIYRGVLFKDQLNRGQKYDEVKDVISINILNYTMFKDIESYHSIWRFRPDENPTHKSLDGAEIHFIELEKFRKTSPDFENKLNQWLAYIDETNPLWVKEVMSKNKTIQKAKNLKEDFFKDKDNRLVADLYKLYCMERNTEIDEARIKGKEDGKKIGELIGRKEGIELGKQEGIELGKQEKAIDIAKNLLSKNIDISIVIQTTGLSKEEIIELKKSYTNRI